MIDLFLQEGDGLSDESEEFFVVKGLGQIVVLSDLYEENGSYGPLTVQEIYSQTVE